LTIHYLLLMLDSTTNILPETLAHWKEVARGIYP